MSLFAVCVTVSYKNNFNTLDSIANLEEAEPACFDSSNSLYVYAKVVPITLCICYSYFVLVGTNFVCIFRKRSFLRKKWLSIALLLILKPLSASSILRPVQITKLSVQKHQNI